MRIGRLFIDQHSQSVANGSRCQFRATIKSEDETVYQSDSLELLDATSDALLKRPVFVEMAYTDYTTSRNLRFNITQGGSHSDRISADGEPSWVRDTFVQLQDRINAAAPTSQWVTKHPYIVRTLAKLGLGSIVWLPWNWLFSQMFSLLPPPSAELLAGLKSSSVAAILSWRPTFLMVDFVLTWINRWLLGNAVWVFVSEWFYRAYPDVDLDFGPEHLKREKMQRHRVGFLAITVALPLVVAVLYDVAKMFFKAA